ncbi:hypothetical protein DY245_04940 [Streptomyces inhibens]|uniref:Secreted protein n=1 Tax=Streptomyces inhibens TaxID=2293571 RepID=A0A371Q9J2_STRIH|nr:hypothetical protein DY245_04940 [Streptomyces inhibens]
MKNMACVKFMIAGACGLLLAVGGASPAQAWDGLDGYGGDGVWNSDTYADFRAVLRCGPRARVCVNGPVNSGNVRNSQNIHMSGNNSNSGSPTNDNGNTQAHDETNGVKVKANNNQLKAGRGGGQKL